MKTIWLKNGEGVLIDDQDYNKIDKYKWRLQKGYKTNYAVRSTGGRKNFKVFLLHRVLLKPSKGIQIDHINRNGLDNRRCNLRLCNAQQNQMNRDSKGSGFSSKYRGVSWHKNLNKWHSSIRINQRRVALGYFVVEEDAAKAYDAAAHKHFGEFCTLNFRKDVL